MGIISNKISRDMLQPGDHIYSWRMVFGYAHHGIYVGNGRVIHFNPECGPKPRTVSSMDKLGGVSSSYLDCFLDGGKLYRFEYSASSITFLAKPRGGACTTMPSDLPEEVVHRADYLLQNGFGVYNVFKNNCESFSVYCKTGLVFIDMAAESSQVLSTARGWTSVYGILVGGAFATVAMVGGAPVMFVAGAVSMPVWFVTGINIGRLFGEKSLKNCEKVPVERLVSQINAGMSRTEG